MVGKLIHFSIVPIVTMSISVHPYTYQGQVYSPAFSDQDQSDSSDEGESLAPSSPLQSSPVCSPRPTRKRKYSIGNAGQRPEFISQRPKYANKYEEMLQPLSPVTTLPYIGRSWTTDIPVPNERLQRQFESVMEEGDVSAMESFLSSHGSSDVNVNQFNCDGRTALQESCLASNLPMARVLLKYGADPRMTTRDGFSTLQLAAFSGHSPLLLYILSSSQQNHLVK